MTAQDEKSDHHPSQQTKEMYIYFSHALTNTEQCILLDLVFLITYV